MSKGDESETYVCFFSGRLQDLFQQEKGRKRPSVPASPGRMRQGDDSKVRYVYFMITQFIKGIGSYFFSASWLLVVY